jgi:hypothetical protein
VEQPNYDEKGELRKDEEGRRKTLDAGHGGMRLRDFVAAANRALGETRSKKRVTDAQVRAELLELLTAFPIKH